MAGAAASTPALLQVLHRRTRNPVQLLCKLLCLRGTVLAVGRSRAATPSQAASWHRPRSRQAGKRRHRSSPATPRPPLPRAARAARARARVVSPGRCPAVQAPPGPLQLFLLRLLPSLVVRTVGIELVKFLPVRFAKPCRVKTHVRSSLHLCWCPSDGSGGCVCVCVCLGSKPVTRLLPSVSLRLASEAILDVLSDALGQEDARRNSFWEATCSLAILHPGRWVQTVLADLRGSQPAFPPKLFPGRGFHDIITVLCLQDSQICGRLSESLCSS